MLQEPLDHPAAVDVARQSRRVSLDLCEKVAAVIKATIKAPHR